MNSREKHPECVVMKFSGATVEDGAAIHRVSKLVKRRLRLGPIVVVSALAKVTDLLMHAGKLAGNGILTAALEIAEGLRERHQLVAREVVDRELYDPLWDELSVRFEALSALLSEIAATATVTPAAQDRLLGMGEWFSSKILHAALLSAGLDVSWVDAASCIVTDAVHTRALPLWQETNDRLKRNLLPLLRSGQIPVMGGFVGATIEGVPTTLGRGSSNFSAAIVGAGLEASRIEIWTDVDGIMTTDPKLCPEARRVTRLSFNEAAEMAHFGLEVLHPAMLTPAMQHNIPVWVLNSRNQQGGGTEITANVSDGGRIKAIAVKRNLAVVDVEPQSWFGRELLSQVFEVFERHGQTVEMLSASHGSLAAVVSGPEDPAAMAAELKNSAHVHWEKQKALVCLVGEKIRRRPEVASQVLHAISDIDLRMMCQGASERSIGFLVDDSRVEEAVRRLHDLLFPVALRPEKDAAPGMMQSLSRPC